MYNYPVLLHFHRKNGDYTACSFSTDRDENKSSLTSETTYFGLQFSFTVTSQEKVDSFTFKAEIDGVLKEYLVRFNYYPLLTEAWILEGDETVYYSENPAIASP